MRKGFAKALLLRPVFLGLLAVGLLAAPPKPSRPATGAAKAVKSSDPADLLKIPNSFSGVVLEAAQKERVLGAFRVTEWVNAPGQFAGSSIPGLRYSERAPLLRGFLGFADREAMALSFNLAIRNGKGYFRAFKWDPDLGPAKTQYATVEDEGEITRLEDGTFQLLGSQYRFLLREKPAEVAWEPTQVSLYRFEGQNVGTMATPSPGRPHGNGMYPNQFVPTWSVGSYLYLTDGRLGRLYFRLFGTDQVAVWPTVVVDGKTKFGPTSFIFQRQIEPVGREDARGLFGRGLAFDRMSGTWPATTYVIAFGSDMLLRSVKVAVERGEKGLTTIEGVSVPVAITEMDAKEILGLARDNGWVVSPSPFSLGRQLLNAFRGVSLTAPVPVFWNTPDSVPAVQRDEQTSLWKADLERVGATLRIPEATGAMITQPPAPFGHLTK